MANQTIIWETGAAFVQGAGIHPGVQELLEAKGYALTHSKGYDQNGCRDFWTVSW